jgi:HEAT repeat protein
MLAQLVARAEEAAPVLCGLLPGPLDVPDGELGRTPPAGQGPLFAAILALGRAAVGPLLALLSDPAPGRRRAAAALLGGLGDPTAFIPLADRCLDPDPGVAEAARRALASHRRSPAMRPVPERLRRALASGMTARATSAARAIAALSDADSIPNLIQVLDGADPGTAAAVAEALASLTLQRHGTAATRWLAWWKENRGRGRAEWLFGGLTSDLREVRVMAEAQLVEVATPPVRYQVDGPPGEREQAAREWAGWFARSGHRL